VLFHYHDDHHHDHDHHHHHQNSPLKSLILYSRVFPCRSAQIAAKHGGELTVKSQQGKGSTFSSPDFREESHGKC
jgi:hypothetical protein